MMKREKKVAHEVLEGKVDMTQSGGAYVVVDGGRKDAGRKEGKDIFVRPSRMNGALEGDIVKVQVKIAAPRKGRGAMGTGSSKPEGEIIEIVERSTRAYAGVIKLSQDSHYGFVTPDSRKIPYDIFVHFDDGVGAPPDGSKVMVRIEEWDSARRSPRGEVVDVLGMPGDNDTEMHAILAEYDLPYRFEQEVLDDAERIKGKITKKEIAARRDMRAVTTFTIDPADAKDFDDALSIQKTAAGWEVGVHIADVTHFVTPGMVVELEAEDRATSVYLVDRTIPMLPERLSNDLCSLRPNEDKLTFSAVFELDEEGALKSEWFGRTVIHSDKRFAYEDAQKIIEGADGELRQEILTLNDLAQKLRRARFKNGSIAFAREEAKFTLDAKGHPTGVFFKVQKEANQLIEEFMLLANRRVAEFIAKKKKPMVYRVHDEPNSDKLSNFGRFISRFGYDFRATEGKAVSKEMNRLMKAIHGKAEENVVSTLAIRTMAKAFYTTDNIGHYGLSFKYYTHFTSPIRRYPDMMVHRLLAAYLADARTADKPTLEKLCEHSSDMEVRAAEAERSSIKYKMVEFMLDKVGEEFDGAISGITDWGIYVELDDTHIEGMVSLRDLTDDFYSFDEESYQVEGQATGRRFVLGDKVRISVVRADLPRKQLDFRMVASYDFESGRAIPVESYGASRDGRDGSRGGAKGSSRGGAKGGSSRGGSRKAPDVRNSARDKGGKKRRLIR